MKESTECLSKQEVIHKILVKHSSQDNPLGVTEISNKAKSEGYTIGRKAIEDYMNRVVSVTYSKDEKLYDMLEHGIPVNGEIFCCKINSDGNRTRGYWVLNLLSDAELKHLLNSTLYSKILTQKEANDLIERIILLSGRELSNFSQYSTRMKNQPFFIEDFEKIANHIESGVLHRVEKIRTAIANKDKVRFDLCIYVYNEKTKKIELEAYKGNNRVNPNADEKYLKQVHRTIYPADIVYDNGRYYLIEAKENFRSYYYRVDLMQNLEIIKGSKISEDSKNQKIPDLFNHRMENPHMFSGELEKVCIKIKAEQFTQVVDWFSNCFEVKEEVKESDDDFYIIELKVNINSFKYWVLQYSECVEVLPIDGDSSFRDSIKETLEKTLKKYK